MNQIKHMSLDDHDRVMEFVKVVFPDAVEVLERLIFHPPFQRPENFAYIEEDGQIVSFAGLLPHTVRLGGSQVRAGEIEAVGTHPDFRKRGLAASLMRYWIEYMRQEGIALGWLYGIPDFYQQFGFEYALPFHQYSYVTVASELLAGQKLLHRIEGMTASDLPEVDRIYADCSRDNSGTMVRSLDYWKYRLQTTNFGSHQWTVLRDEDAVIRGYLWVTKSDSEITVREAGADSEDACQTMAAYLYQQSQATQVGTIGLQGPVSSPLAQYLYRKGARIACTNEIFPGTWAGMVRIVDLANTLEALSSAMTRRLANAGRSTHSGLYAIKSEVGSAGLEISRGQVRVTKEPSEQAQQVWIPGPVLTQMITGYKSLQDHLAEVTVENDELAHLFTVLFPVEHPCVWDLEMSEELL